MCGICGRLGVEPAAAALERSMAALEHRGPDEEGRRLGPGIMLGHRRLSVIDLSTRGRQPMTNEEETIDIVFNGEIYNFRELRERLAGRHRFLSDTDTEVLVHGYEEWGFDGLLERLSGMFALAIWDRGTQTLNLARDRVGKKPLYYHDGGNWIAFASTLPALLELLPFEPVPSPRAIQDYLIYLNVPADQSIVRGVRKLLPGHAARFKREEGLSVHRYWSLPAPRPAQRTEEEWLERMEKTLDAAVGRRLISDVPLGVFLSGGVDSSLVAALAARHSSDPIITISAGFEDREINELGYARTVAEHLGSRHFEHMVRPDLLDSLPRMVYAMGEPIADPAAVPTFLIAREARRTVTVVLTGDGGDETFAGYPGTLIARLAVPYALSVPTTLRRNVIPDALRRLEGLGGRVGWVAKQMRRIAVTATENGGLTWRFDALSERNMREFLPELLTEDFRGSLPATSVDDYWEETFRNAPGTTAADRALHTDLARLLPDLFLVKTDTMTMASGLEARSPLLDPEVLELSARIPVAMKTRHMRSKHLLKRLAARCVPPEVVYRRKHGFAVPTARWLREELAAPSRELLLSDTALRRGIFDQRVIRRLLEDHSAGRADHGNRIWSLMVLELWHRLFIDRTIAPSDTL